MKLISYFQVNAFLRRQRLYHQDETNPATKVDKNNNSTVLNEETATDELVVTYPNNLNLKGWIY